VTVQNILVGLFAAAALSGCAGQQSLLRWSHTHVSGLTPVDDSRFAPTLDVSSQAADPSTPLTAKTLPERPSAAYIAALAANEKQPAKLRELMATPIRKVGVTEEASKFLRVLVLEVQRRGVRPADRFVMTDVEVKPTGPSNALDYIFTDYQLASTTNSTINIGTVAITSQVSTGLAVTPNFAGGQQGSASFGLVNTNASTHNISETSQLSVNVAPNLVTAIRLGGEGIDLVGDVLVKLAIQFPDAAKKTVYIATTDIIDEKTGALKSVRDAKVVVKPTEVVSARDTSVCARLSYVDRRVVKGAEYRDEGRHSVQFISRPAGPWLTFPLISESEMSNSMWVIMAPDAALEIDTGLGLVALVFDDYDQAQQFRNWLMRYRATSVGRRALYDGDIGGNGRPVSRFSNLIVKRLADSIAVAPAVCAP
jgi:hypothetical protein